MINKTLLAFGCFLLSSLSMVCAKEMVVKYDGNEVVERSIVVVIASYNNKDWYKRNLDSVFSQKYTNYRVIYVDDASPDGTGELVEQYIKEHKQEEKFTLLCNQERLGALANQYTAITSCDDMAIIVILDGDDWFAHDQVLAYMNNVYADTNVWLTYGQFKEYPSNKVGFCCVQQISEKDCFQHCTSIRLQICPAVLENSSFWCLEKQKKAIF